MWKPSFTLTEWQHIRFKNDSLLACQNLNWMTIKADLLIFIFKLNFFNYCKQLEMYLMYLYNATAFVLLFLLFAFIFVCQYGYIFVSCIPTCKLSSSPDSVDICHNRQQSMQYIWIINLTYIVFYTERIFQWKQKLSFIIWAVKVVNGVGQCVTALFWLT